MDEGTIAPGDMSLSQETRLDSSERSSSMNLEIPVIVEEDEGDEEEERTEGGETMKMDSTTDGGDVSMESSSNNALNIDKKDGGGSAGGGGSAAQQPKKTVVPRTQSCDSCRSKKARCEMPPLTSPGSSEASSATSSSTNPRRACLNCIRLKRDCLFTYQRRKTGRPPGSTTRRDKGENAQQSANANHSGGSWQQNDSQLDANHYSHSQHRMSHSISSAPGVLPSPSYPFPNSTGPPPPLHSPAFEPPQALPRPSLPSMHSLSNSLLHHHHHGVSSNAPDIDAFLNVSNHPSPGDAFSLHQSRNFASRAGDFPVPGSAVSQPASLLFDGHHSSLAESPYGQTPSVSARHLLDFAGGGGGGAPGSSGAGRGMGVGNGQRLSSNGPERSPNRTDSSAGWLGGPHGRRQSHGSGAGGGGPPNERFYLAIRPPEIQVEDVMSWNTVSFFTSLFIRHTHALCQVVHVPTFTRALVARRDKHDRQFRAFLLGLITFIIGQSPLSRLEVLCSRQELEVMQDNCHRASMVLHNRTAKKPTLQHIATLMCGYFHCTTVSRSCEAGALLAEACHIMQWLQRQTPEEGATRDICHEEIKKRMFWYLYTIDTTEASSGNPMHLNDFEEFPDFPMEVEDELITVSGAFPQPADRLSAMTGFVALLKLFRLMQDCIIRHRQLKRFLVAAGAAAGGEPVVIPQMDAEQSLAWAEDALTQAEEIMNTLPPQLGGEQDIAHLAEDEAAVFGMQRANLLITALSLQFVVFEYKLTLSPESEVVMKQRENAGRRGIEMLKGISLDDLAANGESMRGKVLRILLAELGFSESVLEWWDLYSNIQFVQVVPQNLQSLMPSRAPSPIARDT